MFFCIGITMRLGLISARKFGTFIVLLSVTLISSLCVFISSYLPSFSRKLYIIILVFVIFFAVIFGLVVGSAYMIPLY
jgi:hypothetical protein